MTYDPDIAVTRIGRGHEPLVVIDNFFPDPEMLCSAARTASFVPAFNAYPGLRASLPDGYWSGDRLQLMAGVIERSFGMTGPIHLIDASFSIVTTRPDKLTVAQRLPHCDAFVPNQIALVHYLSRDCLDGTAFYRHRSTGFETIVEHHRQIYLSQIDFELRHFGMPSSAFIAGDTPMFEQITSVEGQFNRALLYRGWQLHSGAIGPGASLSPDPNKGRLTVTAFLTVG